MIDKEKSPLGWAFMSMEFAEAHEHLGKLLDDLANSSDYDESRLRVDLGHIYAHLNRAWYCRVHEVELTKIQWDAGRVFPLDIEPVV